jgi:ribosomal-protein-alanine N-acetyltransferase
LESHGAQPPLAQLAMILTTRRLHLREFDKDDWPAVLAYQSKPLYLRYYKYAERTTEDVVKFVQMFLDQQQEMPRLNYQLAVVHAEKGRLIGTCGIRRRAARAHKADIGYELDPDFWGRGYATEAARAIVRFGFDELGLHRIWSWCIADNLASARVLERLGMCREGRLRENEYFKDRWWDTLLYGILEHEWRAQQGRPKSLRAKPDSLTSRRC